MSVMMPLAEDTCAVPRSAAASPARAPNPVQLNPRLLALQRRLASAAVAAATADQLTPQIAQIVGAYLQAAVLHLDQRNVPRLRVLHETPGLRRVLNDDLLGRITQYGDAAAQHGGVAWGTIAPYGTVVAASLTDPDETRDVDTTDALIVLLPGRSEVDEGVPLLLQFAAAQIGHGRFRLSHAAAEKDFLAATALFELIERAETCDDLASAAALLTSALREHFGVREVFLGLAAAGQPPCRVRSISGRTDFDRHGEFTRTVESALDESMLLGSLCVLNTGTTVAAPGQRAHQRLLETLGVGRLISAPIVDRQGVARGAWLFAGEAKSDNVAEQSTSLIGTPSGVSLLKAAGPRVAGCLALLERAERGPLARLGRGLKQKLRNRRAQAIGLGLALTLAAMFVPVPHRVKCDCELQPLRRTYVAAPFDGRLEKSLVEAGDLVEPGQLLAQLDGREIRWELAAVTADVQRAEKQRDGHLAKQDFGAAEVARFEVERLQLKQRLLEHRSQNLEIRSPGSGLVITGDLKKAEGAPLSVGQTMFEIGPLDELLVEMSIPQDDVAYVEPNTTVDLALDAFPQHSWAGNLERIHPRAEVKDHEHVFIGETLLENSAGLLRPGMRGQAEVSGRSRALGWVLFHKPWEKLTLWLGW